MMQLQFENGSERIGEVRKMYDTNHQRDLFMYALAGIMALYLDKETLAHCIASAQDSFQVIHREVLNEAS